MVNVMEKPKNNKLMACVLVGVVVAGLFALGYPQYKEYQLADFNHQVSESAKESQLEFQKQMDLRRKTGFVETVKYTNAFNEVVSVDYNIIGITEGSTIQVSQKESGVDSVCFSVLTNSDTKKLFAPLVSVPVYVKFDGGETKTFNATRGSSTFYLCIGNKTRFLNNMKAASKVEVALPFLEYSNHITEIYEFNLKTFNGVIQ